MTHQNDRSVEIGHQVRRRREQRGLTAAELARRAGLSKGTLSALESGRANPTIDTLDSVAQALAIPLTDIISAPDMTPTALTRPADDTGHPIQQQLLSRIPGGHRVETWRLRMHPGASFEGVQHTVGTREQLVVTAGSLVAGHSDDPHRLGVGDSLVFDGTAAHRYVAEADGADVVVILATPTA